MSNEMHYQEQNQLGSTDHSSRTTITAFILNILEPICSGSLEYEGSTDVSLMAEIDVYGRCSLTVTLVSLIKKRRIYYVPR